MGENGKDKAKKGGKKLHWRVIVGWSLSLIFLLIYWVRPDSLYGIHVWPMYSWTALIILLAFRRGLKKIIRHALLVLLPWGLAMWAVGELPYQFFLRPDFDRPAEATTVRVVSINCYGGTVLPLKDALEFDPDVILIQESPSQPKVEEVFEDLGQRWDVLVGPDGAIATKWKMDRHGQKITPEFASARIIPPEGEPFLVCSLRLAPVNLRFDYYRRSCWKTWAEDQPRRREELSDVWTELKPGTSPLIIGGDFNTSNRKMMDQVIGTSVKNTFDTAGKGWPATFMSQFPLIRIDHILASPEMQPVQNFAVRTRSSDHMIVVADIKLPK
jgi:hypothetical protein